MDNGAFKDNAAGGSGGGGGGASRNGTANTGGGGGGDSALEGTAVSGSGGSGVVIFRYADTFAAATSTTGSPNVAVTGGFRIYTFNGSGSITF
jgi:hypothetical protein